MSDEIRVDLPFGTLHGLRDARGAAFLGIPYAEPPIGERRFRPPVPRRRFGAFDARRPGPAPSQLIRPEPDWSAQSPVTETSEDCLTLNVFTPAADDARRPVLVHVFGGGFQTGSASSTLQDGAALAAQGDAVVVRVNFRLGALGFLHLGDVWGAPHEAGNVALLDLCAALVWVRENIAGLGGDPGNITLFGLSSGAFMIAALFAVREARGLFHRAWMQSGSASRIIPADIATAQAREFLRLVGVAPGDAAALAAVPVGAILDAQSRICALDLGERNAPGGRTLGIVCDGRTVAEHPRAALGKEAARAVPLVLGATRDEARLWFARGLMRPAESDAALHDEIARFVGEERAVHLLQAYRAAHPDRDRAGLREQFLTDAIYRLPALQTALAQAAAGGEAYLYRFDWRSPMLDGALGASHGFDEAFVWNAVERAPYARGSRTAPEVAASLSGALHRFARTGSPGWSPVAAASPHVERFGGDDAADDTAWLMRHWAGIERA